MAEFEINKRSAGVFLTQGDPFGYDAVRAWVQDAVSGKANVSICEPYAGTNSLLFSFDAHFHDFLPKTSWSGYDIMPPKDEDNLFPKAEIKRENTLLDIPTSSDIIITNPPYLARNSARRRKLDFPFDYKGKGIERPADLYQIALDTCLAHAGFCAMLIPESFITSRYDKSRLSCVISLPGDLFDDTDCPVCLALFVPDRQDDFDIFRSDGKLLGSYSDIVEKSDAMLGCANERISFNIPSGEIGLRGVDNTSSDSIKFVRGETIASDRIKVSSRSITRIHIDGLSDNDIDAVIERANVLLGQWRKTTNDILMTAFKGERKDGRYRRRLSFDYAERILDKVLEN